MEEPEPELELEPETISAPNARLILDELKRLRQENTQMRDALSLLLTPQIVTQ